MFARGCGHVWAAEPDWQTLGIDCKQPTGSIDHVQCRVPEPAPTVVCPACSKQDAVWPNLNGGTFYVSDHWKPQKDAYHEFVTAALQEKKKLVILEVGVGYNSPGAIRVPNERIASHGATLLRVNLQHPGSDSPLPRDRFVPMPFDAATAIEKLGELLGA